MTEIRDTHAPEDDTVDAAADLDVSAQPSPRPFSGQSWLMWGWRTLTSMRTALILLFLLVLGAVPGSMLPQEGNDPGGVANYFKSHPALAPLLNHLGLFNVFAAPWFAAIYLLLFTSLVGCVVPRTFKLVGSARSLPPRAPRNLSRLPLSAVYPSSLAPERAIEVAASTLSKRGFRVRGEDGWVSAEKGYLREVGNLLFHLALLGILISVALGGLLGYKADKVLVTGNTFSDTASQLDEFHPGRLVTDGDLAPFSITLKSFNASYYTSGSEKGSPSAFDAKISYTSNPGAAPATYDLRVNHPLNVDGTKVYLIGHGFAPVFKVTDGRGQVVYDQATVFIPDTSANNLSQGVVKVPDAMPSQLGFAGVFLPTAVDIGGQLQSAFPSALNPAVSLIGYQGNLGLDSGVPQSVYQLDTAAMHRIGTTAHVMTPGQSWTIKGYGTITFTGYTQWISLQVTYDPGQLPALICAVLALCGLVLSFLIRRRRVFVRATAAEDGSTVTFGGLARTDASGGFSDEFAELAAELRQAHVDQQEAGA
jgi:cytochrome c biogenesis protein